MMEDPKLIRLIQQHASPVNSLGTDKDGLIKYLRGIETAEIVLLGEASHGTHDFYRMRAEITKRLISEMGFNAVAIEGDWPDASRVNRYVMGRNNDVDSEMALSGFKRFPNWMWRNADVLDFVGWLRAHNDKIATPPQKAGFYGLDLYSLYSSMDEVVQFLEITDREAADRARNRYACFDHCARDSQSYAYMTHSGLSPDCESQVLAQLLELQTKRMVHEKNRGGIIDDDLYEALQNALVVKNAEQYYRTMLQAEVSSWNLRDGHMFQILEALRSHLKQTIPTPKIVVWAHNSHLGDARATQMADRGELNLGQLTKKRYGDRAFSLGFTTYCGSVTAASGWGAAPERKEVKNALPGSYENLFHLVGTPRFILNFRGNDFLHHALKDVRLERAIGVIYLPQTERESHYFEARLSSQFDAVFHLDETRAVEPLEKSAQWFDGEAPETYPSAM